MIDRQHGNLVFECDSCSETFEAESKDFNTAWSAAKAEGWTATKNGDFWLHGCPECGVQR